MITSGSSSELATGVVDGPRRTEMRACWQSQTLRSSVRRYILTLVYSGVRRRRGGSSTARGATSGNLGALEEEGRGGRGEGGPWARMGAGGGRWSRQQSRTTHPATPQGCRLLGTFHWDMQFWGDENGKKKRQYLWTHPAAAQGTRVPLLQIFDFGGKDNILTQLQIQM